MPTKFASGKHAIAQCDRCNFRYPLKQLRELVIKTKNVNLLVCPTCWDPDQPQLQLGLYPVNDPQAIRNPRTDSNSYFTSGVNANGFPSEGSRIIQWGWNPVGGPANDQLTPSTMVMSVGLSSVSVSIT